ncbi:MAG TPA: hypothetical protein VF981_12355 [Gemmatimonadaceae bacterium]
MPVRLSAAFAALLAFLPAVGLGAQHAGGPGGAPAVAPSEARQFDFLIGEWRLDVRPRVSGLAARLHGAPRLSGTWKAWRAFDGWGIQDELRIVDAGGNLQSLTHALRVYDATAQRWSQMGLDVLRARYNPSIAEWNGREMVITTSATDQEGKPHLVRVRFFDIGATAFKYEQARSYDGGKKWDDPLLTMSASK